MINSCLSFRAAERFSGTALASYLRSAGWTVQPSRTDGVSIFSKRLAGADEPVHVLLPELPGIEDEHHRIADALRTIEVVEARPIWTIVDQIIGDSGNRIGSEHFKSGTVVAKPALADIGAEQKLEAPGEVNTRSPATF